MKISWFFPIIIFQFFKFGSTDYCLECWVFQSTTFLSCYVTMNPDEENNYQLCSDSPVLNFETFDQLLTEYLDKLVLNDDSEFKNIKNQTLKGGACLMELYMTSCSINHLEDYFFQNLLNLQTLSLTSNKLESLSENLFYGLENLQKLFLNKNLLKDFGLSCFKHLPNLQLLHLENNRIRELNENIFEPLKKLNYLNIAENSLEILPKNLFKNNLNLDELNFNLNKIKKLDENHFVTLKKLRILKIGANFLEVVPNKLFKTNLNLIELNLNSNNIEMLDANIFETLKDLKILQIGKNLLANVPNNLFKNNINLEELNIGINQIKNLDENIFVNLRNLTKLNLQFNSLEFINGSLFKNNTNLKELDLKFNNISYFTKDVVDSFKNLILLDLTNNDCVNELFDYNLVQPNHPDKILNFVLFPLCEKSDFEEDSKDHTALIAYLVGSIITFVFLILILTLLIIFIRKRKHIRQKLEAENDEVAENGRPDFSNLVQEYTDQSTIHGVKYLGEPKRHWTEKSFWIAIVLVCVCFSTYHIYQNYRKWDATPVIIGFNNEFSRIFEIPFPAITICPELKLTLDYDENNHDMLEQLSTLAQIFPDFYDITIEKTKNYSNFETDPENYANMLGEIGLNFYSHVSLFTWKGYGVSMGQTPAYILTDSGLCESFNLLNSSEIFNTKVLSQKSFDSLNHLSIIWQKNSFLWSPEAGYYGSLSFKSYPLRSLEASAHTGVHIHTHFIPFGINKQYEIIPNGYKLILHNPHDWPQMSKNYIQISINQKYKLMIKPQITKTSEALKSYDPKVRQCYYPDENPLKFFKIYTRENCEFECLTDFVLEACGCVMFYMPRKNESRVCNFRDIECTRIVFRSSFIGQTISNPKSVPCDCFPTCQSVQYNYDIRQTELNLTGTDQESFQTTELEVYFEEDRFATLQRSELFGLTDFISNCGGLLGLFMGMSILSFAEVIYYFTIRCACNSRKKKVV